MESCDLTERRTSSSNLIGAHSSVPFEFIPNHFDSFRISPCFLAFVSIPMHDKLGFRTFPIARRTEGPLAGRFEHAIGQRRRPVQAIGAHPPVPLELIPFHSESFQNFIKLSKNFLFPCTTSWGLELFLLLRKVENCYLLL